MVNETVNETVHASGPGREELVDKLLAGLRERLLAADSFECRQTATVERGWEAAPCGRRVPRYGFGNPTRVAFEIYDRPPGGR